MSKYLILFFAIPLLLTACSKTTSTEPVSNAFIHANTGSTFTFDEYTTDSTNAVIAASRDTLISTVLRTDGSLGGRAGVLIVENKTRNSRDTSYYVYESNNNLSILSSGSNGTAAWLTIPAGTGITTVTASADSTTNQGITTIVRDSTIISLIGTENLSVQGQSISTKKIQLTFREVITANGVKGLDASVNNMLYYAPSLGFVVRTTSPSRLDPAGGWIDGSFQSLIDYVLK